MNITLILLTDGRQHCLDETIKSARENLFGEFNDAILIDDSMNEKFADEIELKYGHEFRMVHNEIKLGFGGAIRKAWSMVSLNCDYIFHLEDDFTFKEDIRLQLPRMIKVLEENPYLGQLVLKRQPWNEEEKQAGGIVEVRPDNFEEKNNGFDFWTEHSVFWSTNPNIYKREMIDVGWPEVEHSEGHFTFKCRDLGYKFAFWGKKFDPPKVQHNGGVRIGTGY